MKYGMVLVIVLFGFLGLFSAPSWAETENVSIYFRGEEIKLTLSIDNGRFYGLYQEMIRLVPELDISWEQDNAQGDLKWIPLRAFWEEIGFQVNWLPELDAIIISEKTDSYSLVADALAIVGQAVADVDWLRFKTEKTLREHLSKFYTPEAVERVLPDTLDFVKIETDWHSLWALVNAEAIDWGENWLLLKVTISEKMDPFSAPVNFPGIIKMHWLESGWRIDSYRYLAD